VFCVAHNIVSTSSLDKNMGGVIGKIILEFILPIIFFMMAIAVLLLAVKGCSKEDTFKRHEIAITRDLNDAMRVSALASSTS
jgi:hypothetical protein